jgi:glycosyltransferase involved in cell wall biosynthesis
MSLSATAQPVNPPTRAHLPAHPGGGRFAGKRVAMLTFSPYPFDPRPRRVVDALVQEGATVDLVCLGSPGAPGRESLNGVRVFRVPLKHPRAGKLQYGLRYGSFILISSVLFAWRCFPRPYDLVYVHNMPDILVLSALVPKAFGAKVVLDLHDVMPELMKTIFNAAEGSASVRLLRFLEKWSIARTDLAITINLASAKIFTSRSCPPEKMAVVMNTPDTGIFSFRAPEPIAQATRLAQKPFVVMYHGTIVERNGLDLAIEALAKTRDSIPNAELRVFGPSTQFLERVLQMTRERKLEGIVRYLGPRSLEQLVKEIQDCDLGVIPNHRNAFTATNTPVRIFEYLALGKPVIAPCTPGIQDYFGEGSLLFFEPGNADELARQFEYTYSHPAEVLEIVRNGQKVYLEHTWEKERQTLLDRLGEILDVR